MALFSDLLSSTPDNLYKSKDRVYLKKDTVTLVRKKLIPEGNYYFDCYDTADGTCYIAPRKHYIPKKAHKTFSFLTFNVKLSDIRPTEKPELEGEKVDF